MNLDLEDPSIRMGFFAGRWRYWTWNVRQYRLGSVIAPSGVWLLFRLCALTARGDIRFHPGALLAIVRRGMEAMAALKEARARADSNICPA